jgi:hypothetical protein
VAIATRRRGLDVSPVRHLRAGKPLMVVAVIAIMVALYPLLRNDSPWPSGLTYALNERLDDVYSWIVDNQGSSWIYVYFLNQITSFLNWLVT